ncbi:MAG: hypothetical protein H6741_02425 [Alphaproteobacteria bacterium]|nr:hypothetical protein [Alphaproteobacteria bacterium]MCB9791560.1 hypothetical protein [Alphaproteobacteria bacterium]
MSQQWNGEIHLCRWLRWKGFIGAAYPSQEALARALTFSDSTFTCLKTRQFQGPDDGMCSPESCAPGRSCYELSKRIPRVKWDEPSLS